MNHTNTHDSSNSSTVTLPAVLQSVIDGEEIQTVNARELHAFLEVKDHFRNWIKERIDSFGFVENQDFVSFAEKSAKPYGGRPAKEYHLTIDMAKEISMVQNNAKGQQARRYFIRCEKKLHNVTGLIQSQVDQAVKIAMDGIMTSMVERQVVLAVESRLKDDPRVAVQDMVSTREILDAQKVPAKKRRGLLLSASHSIRDFCLQMGATAKRCARTGTWLFPVEVANKWKKAVGNSMIADHMSALHGQLKLNLVPMASEQKQGAGQ
ncbi:MAG: antA/AntB antirepressor family protein [Magnetococcales bacterium]|nr:antA/AntB antirepressor family protein [Magnetococcales bacterium]